MSPIFYIGFLVALLPPIVTGSKDTLGSECISRKEFEDLERRLFEDLENRLSSEIQLRKKLEADIENIKASFDKTDTGSYNTGPRLKTEATEDVNNSRNDHELSGQSVEHPDKTFPRNSSKNELYREAILYYSKHASKPSGKRQNRIVQDEALSGRAAFTVELVTNLDNLGAGQTIRFDNIVSQLGNGFNSRTGEFTTTYSGWYVFTLTMAIHGSHELELHIVHDGVPIARCWGKSDEYTDSVTQTVITHSTVGAVVWVQTHPVLALSHSLYGEHHTTFTGFLLYPD